MPLLGLGTKQLKHGGECRDVVRAALRSGYRLIDTAATYANEEDVGNGIRASGLRREDVFLVTKLSPADHGGEEDVQEALNASLQRLGTKYIDLYLIQSPRGGCILETWGALLSLKARGLARAVGVSNFSTHHLDGLAAAGLEAPEVNQIELNFACQQRALCSRCARAGIAVMASSPLACGRLFGAQTDLGGLAARRGRTQAELAVRWCLQHGYVAIPRTKDARRVEANAPFGFSLSAAEMREIDALDRGLASPATTKCMSLPWEDAIDEISDVGEEDLRDGKGQRRRRRRKRKGKGKGKGSEGPANSAKGAGRKGGGSTASRWSDMLAGLS